MARVLAYGGDDKVFLSTARLTRSRSGLIQSCGTGSTTGRAIRHAAERASRWSCRPVGSEAGWQRTRLLFHPGARGCAGGVASSDEIQPTQDDTRGRIAPSGTDMVVECTLEAGAASLQTPSSTMVLESCALWATPDSLIKEEEVVRAISSDSSSRSAVSKSA